MLMKLFFVFSILGQAQGNLKGFKFPACQIVTTGIILKKGAVFNKLAHYSAEHRLSSKLRVLPTF
jgi:hypothetical protein